MMLIDVLFLAMMVMAVFKGMRNGLIVAVFSIIGWVVGLYAAFMFSGLAETYLKGVLNLSPRILSIVAFILVFSLVIFLVNLGARIVEKVIGITPIGWLNRLGGIFFYVLLYTLIFSVMIYFAEKVRLVSEETVSSSKVYPWVKPVARIIELPFIN
jgi:membrane protein required for colicin V production